MNRHRPGATGRRVLLRTCVVALAMLVAAPAAMSRPAVAAPVPTLAGTTVIRGDEPATAWVSLTTAATLSYNPDWSSPDIAYAGNGGVIGFQLYSLDRTVEFHAMQFNGCDTPGCTPRPVAVVFGQPVFVHALGCTCPTGSPVTLPAGTYHLTFWAQGADASVTLTLHGPSGSQTITPESAANVLIARPPTTVSASVSPGPLLESGGMSVAVADPLTSFAAIGVTMHGQGPAIALRGGCVYDGDPPGGAFLPGCPGGTSIPAEDDSLLTTTPWGAGYSMEAGFPPGSPRYGVGAYAVGGAEVTDSSWLLVVVQAGSG